MFIFCSFLLIGCNIKNQENVNKDSKLEEEKEILMLDSETNKKIDEEMLNLEKGKIENVTIEESQDVEQEEYIKVSSIDNDTNNKEIFYPQNYSTILEVVEDGMNFGMFQNEYFLGESDFYETKIENEEQAINHLNKQMELLLSSNDVVSNKTKVDNTMIEDFLQSAYRFKISENNDVFVLSSYATKYSKGLATCSARRFAMDTFLNELIKTKGYDWEVQDSCVAIMNHMIYPYTYSANAYSPSEDKGIHIYCKMTTDNVFLYYMTKE